MLNFARLAQLRAERPLIHCLSNLVSIIDCANVCLAVGARPIMAQAPEEAAFITAASRAVVLNLGTPSAEKFRACRLSGQTAARQALPLVLDPVGVSASAWRLSETRKLLSHCAPAILRVNASEARALLGRQSRRAGVDSPEPSSLAASLTLARQLSQALGCAVLLSGAQDVLADGERLLCIDGGSALTPQVTGTGCMLSVLCGAFAAVEPERWQAAALAALFWKRCAQRADERASGPGSFRAALLDEAAALEQAQLKQYAKDHLFQP